MEEREEARERKEEICGDADEEEEREKDEEMRGRDSGISHKVLAVSRRPVLGSDRFLDEPRQRNCESVAQNHRETDHASMSIKDEKHIGISASPNISFGHCIKRIKNI